MRSLRRFVQRFYQRKLADGVTRLKGEMFQRWGLLFLIDTGMSRKVKVSQRSAAPGQAMDGNHHDRHGDNGQRQIVSAQRRQETWVKQRADSQQGSWYREPNQSALSLHE